MFSGVFLRLINNSILQNSTSLLVSDLQTIQCHSDSSEADGQPQWKFPDGTSIRDAGGIVATKSEGFVALRRVDNSTSVPLGQYCCQAQDARGVNHTLCVSITDGEQL